MRRERRDIKVEREREEGRRRRSGRDRGEGCVYSRLVLGSRISLMITLQGKVRSEKEGGGKKKPVEPAKPTKPPQQPQLPQPPQPAQGAQPPGPGPFELDPRRRVFEHPKPRNPKNF